MGEPKGRRRYDRDFKEGAVRLVLDGGRSVRSVARDLGIHENMLHRWKAEYLEDREHAFPGKGHMKLHEEELLKMKKRIADLVCGVD
jgi:transposase